MLPITHLRIDPRVTQRAVESIRKIKKERLHHAVGLNQIAASYRLCAAVLDFVIGGSHRSLLNVMSIDQF
ncbi:MAG: hypothetical protein QOH33_1832 [Paraburkholderia sp.]|jgi:hypothetical protein|nr:hypothetical protein [Paraburkholderia sp.]